MPVAPALGNLRQKVNPVFKKTKPHRGLTQFSSSPIGSEVPRMGTRFQLAAADCRLFSQSHVWLEAFQAVLLFNSRSNTQKSKSWAFPEEQV